MTMPPGLRGRSVAEADERLDQPLGNASLLLFGVLPVKYDDMRIVSHENGRSFHERSRMLLLYSWQHERSVIATGAGACEVRDRLTFRPRVGHRVVRELARRLVAGLFRHRHRRLAAWAAGSSDTAYGTVFRS